MRPRLADELQGQYTDGFLRGIDEALELNYRERPQSVAEWRSLLGLGPDRSTTDPHETRHGTPTSDSEATIVMPKPGPDRHRQTEQADLPTVVLSTPSNLEAASRSLAVDPSRPDPAGGESRSRRVDWLRTHWLSALSLMVVTGIMVLLAWLWVEHNGGGVIPGRAPPSGQPYQDPGSAPPPQGSESDASAIRDESIPPPGQELGRHAEISKPPTVVMPSELAPVPPTPEQQIAGVLDGFDCTPLQVERRAEGDYAISGHVAGRADPRKLDTELSAIAHATIDVSGVSVVPRPLCPLLELIGHYATERRLTIVPNYPSGRYTTGDEFSVAFRNSDHASGRLYAFYINSVGEVYAPPEAIQSALIRQRHGSADRLRGQRTRNRPHTRPLVPGRDLTAAPERVGPH